VLAARHHTSRVLGLQTAVRETNVGVGHATHCAFVTKTVPKQLCTIRAPLASGSADPTRNTSVSRHLVHVVAVQDRGPPRYQRSEAGPPEGQTTAESRQKLKKDSDFPNTIFFVPAECGQSQSLWLSLSSQTNKRWMRFEGPGRTFLGTDGRTYKYKPTPEHKPSWALQKVTILSPFF
jgi:hypothetical protein